MQQGAQLCFSGNFLVDRSQYPPLASRVLTSSGGGGPAQTPRRVCSRWSTGPPFIRGAWGDPKHRGAIRPKPQCKLSRMSQLLTIYTNCPATSNLLRDHARALSLRREISRKSDQRRQYKWTGKIGPRGYGGSLLHVREEGRLDEPQCAQFRVEAEEITSQGQDGKYLPQQRRSRPRRISRAHDNYARA